VLVLPVVQPCGVCKQCCGPILLSMTQLTCVGSSCCISIASQQGRALPRNSPHVHPLHTLWWQRLWPQSGVTARVCCWPCCRSPSALPALQEVLQGPAPPKLLLVGAGLNSDCIPRRSNYSTFAAAATAAQGGSSGAGPAVQASPAGVVADGSRSGSMLVVLQQVGHLQFLATQTALQR
jgi:hypothetical protein